MFFIISKIIARKFFSIKIVCCILKFFQTMLLLFGWAILVAKTKFLQCVALWATPKFCTAKF